MAWSSAPTLATPTHILSSCKPAKTEVEKQNSLTSNVLCIYDIITTITITLVKKYSFILTQSFINISNNVVFLVFFCLS